MDQTGYRRDFTGGVATVTLNRPDVHNALDDTLIAGLTAELVRLDQEKDVRAVVLTGSGKSFCAGGDLNWMKRAAGYSELENRADALGVARLMATLNRLSKPTLALVQGPAYGGGVGLIACCDIAIAAGHAMFSLSEVRLGIIPAVVGPYVMAAIGERAARRYFLTGERFDAAEAHRLGLVHQVVPGAELYDAAAKVLMALGEGGPLAQNEAKDFIRHMVGAPIDENLIVESAERIAKLRASPEGREGIGAFLAKRKAAWRPG